MKLLSVIAISLNWFNPAVYLLSAAKQADCEASCDQTVMAKTQDGANRQFYAELIMEMVGDRRSRGTLLSTCFYGGKRGLRQRMEAIMTGAVKVRKAAFALPVLVLAMIVLSGSLFVVAPAPAYPAGVMSREEALQLLLEDLGAGQHEISDLIIEEEWMDGQLWWEFYFTLEGRRYNTYVHGVTGEVFSPDGRISQEQAVEAVLGYLGVEAGRTRLFDAYIGVFDGVLVWEIVMEFEGVLGEYYVDIYTGQILNVETLDFRP